MTSLSHALQLATRYWSTKRDARVMTMRAQACVDILGASRKIALLKASDAIHVLAGLRDRGLSRGSQASYYAAFRRMLALSGVSTVDWPKGPTPPRRSREPLTAEAIGALKRELAEDGYHETVDLAQVLEATGLRVEVEALTQGAWRTLAGKALHVTGKGGHERTIPIEDPEAWAILTDNRRVRKMCEITYSGHLKRWQKAARKAGITTKLPTPHAVRHYYATRAYGRCRDIRVVQELLGHSDIATTARYVGADVQRMREAVGG